MTQLGLSKTRPSHAASPSSLPEGETGLPIRWWRGQRETQSGPASAQGYGSARAGLQSKPAEKEKR